uniref:Fe2OG dioxygenase domain-containing protein n=1 Tax=Aureoumbra lagunensis TaxID=44058 RepID=A0A7S3JU52_9STRA
MIIPRLVVLSLSLAFGSGEETCVLDKDGSKMCGSMVVEVFGNGESGEPRAMLELDKIKCVTRATFEAAVSVAGCGDAASCEPRDAVGRWPRNCQELIKMAMEDGVQPAATPIRVYAVPRNKRFIFATEEIGFTRRIPHIENGNITLTTLALRPRLFGVEGFLSPTEADALIDEALAINDEEHKLMRSSTGASGYNPSKMRTSENAWLQMSEPAISLKQRAFGLLGFPVYNEKMADGLQILRYNISKAYIAHHDYLSRPSNIEPEAMDPFVGGANRLATLFLYLSDVEDGGQTVFPDVTKEQIFHDHDIRATYFETRQLSSSQLSTLRESAGIFDPKSWEFSMVQDCYSKLAVRPKKARAILYYSQFPTGKLDPLSKHGGCPVLNGTKWAANLWLWNKEPPFTSSRFQKTPPHKNIKAPSSAPSSPIAIEVMVTYDGEHSDLVLYWEGTVKMNDLKPRVPLRLKTYVGHKFVAKISDDTTISTFTVLQGIEKYKITDHDTIYDYEEESLSS